MAKKRLFYLDTNALFPLVSVTAASDWLKEIRDGVDNFLVVSELAQLEFDSVIEDGHRNGGITADRVAEMRANLADLVERERTITRLHVTAHYQRARELIVSNPGMKAPDALHLALALDYADTPETAALVSGDRELLEAASAYRHQMRLLDVHGCRCPKCGKMVRLQNTGVDRRARCTGCGHRCDPCKPAECEKYADRQP